MNDMHQGLGQTLRGAVPDAPSLTGLAARAEADGRRRRRQHRAVVGAGAAAVLVALASSLALNPEPTPRATLDNPSSTPVTAAAGCDIEVDTRTGDRVRRAPVTPDAVPVSVRFCAAIRNQPGGQRANTLVPDAALTTDVWSTVDELEDTVRPNADCEFRTVGLIRYRIQIAYDDGSRSDLPSQACDRGFPILVKAIGRQQAADYPDIDTAVSCADSGILDRAGDVFIGSPLAELTPLPAISAVRCVEKNGALESTPVADPDGLRATLLSDVFPGIFDCVNGAPQVPKVRWVLKMANGTFHTVTFEGGDCGSVVFDNKGAGSGGALLRDLATS